MVRCMSIWSEIDMNEEQKKLFMEQYGSMEAFYNSRHYTIRELRTNEIHLLKDFLYEAIFIPEGMEPPAREIIEQPELKVYTDDFGARKGDHCLVADLDGRVVGAVWTKAGSCDKVFSCRDARE